MFGEKIAAPLSPPTSPRMSDAAAKHRSSCQWQQPSVVEAYLPRDLRTHGSPADSQASANEASRPPLRSYKSFPYSMGPSSRLQHEVEQEPPGPQVLTDFRQQAASQGPQPVASSALPPATYGGSAPTSPSGRLTPHSPEDERGEQQAETDEMDFETAGHDEDDSRQPMTAAELRAQKRKMKRFR